MRLVWAVWRPTHLQFLFGPICVILSGESRFTVANVEETVDNGEETVDNVEETGDVVARSDAWKRTSTA